MGTLAFSIERWAAWAPGLESAADWAAWSAGAAAIAETPDKPDVGFLPAMLRRRTSRVTRAALWAAHHCGGDEGARHTVFGSRHGELHRSHGLLTELAAAEPLSPNAFSLSVHNTASGLYSIATGNRAPSTALAAGRDTLAAGIIEAAGRLRAGADRVLLVHADERVPAFYRRWVADGPAVFAVGLVVGQAGGAGDWRLTRAGGDEPEAAASDIDLMHLVAGDRRRLLMAGEREPWLWERD